MGRTREFDMDQALDAAISTFWTHGYEATSMADLMEATGLHKGSLYKAFADKHDIFMKSLGRYLDGAYAHMQVALSDANSPLDGLRAWLNAVVLLCRDQPVQRGCLALNAAVELGPHDGDVTAMLRSHHGRTSKLLIETIVSGQRSGEIRTDLSSDQLAQTLFIFSAGLLGASKVLSGAVDPEEMVDSALAMIRCC